MRSYRKHLFAVGVYGCPASRRYKGLGDRAGAIPAKKWCPHLQDFCVYTALAIGTRLPVKDPPLSFGRDGYPRVQIGFLCYVPLIHAVPR
jgi:hypothetical protein